MARSPAPAPADQPDAPDEALRVTSVDRDGVGYPAVLLKGEEARRKGSSLRVTLENGRTYRGKVHASQVTGEGVLVETEGLTPEGPGDEPPPPAQSDVVPG